MELEDSVTILFLYRKLFVIIIKVVICSEPMSDNDENSEAVFMDILRKVQYDKDNTDRYVWRYYERE